MDFAFIRNRFGQPFRPNFSIDRNRNGADQVTILNPPGSENRETGVQGLLLFLPPFSPWQSCGLCHRLIYAGVKGYRQLS